VRHIACTPDLRGAAYCGGKKCHAFSEAAAAPDRRLIAHLLRGIGRWCEVGRAIRTYAVTGQHLGSLSTGQIARDGDHATTLEDDVHALAAAAVKQRREVLEAANGHRIDPSGRPSISTLSSSRIGTPPRASSTSPGSIRSYADPVGATARTSTPPLRFPNPNRLRSAAFSRVLVEQSFGWMKTAGLMRKLRHRGRRIVGRTFTFTATGYNLVRMRPLGLGVAD